MNLKILVVIISVARLEIVENSFPTLAAEILLVALAVDDFYVVPSAAGFKLHVKELVDNGKTGNISELDVPSAVKIVIVVDSKPHWIHD